MIQFVYLLFLATAGNAELGLKKKTLNEEMERFRKVDRKFDSVLQSQRKFDSVLRPDSQSFIAIAKKKYPQLIQESEVAVKMAQGNVEKEKEKEVIQIEKIKKVKKNMEKMTQDTIEKVKEKETKQINSIKEVNEKTEKMAQNIKEVEKFKNKPKMIQNNTKKEKEKRTIQIKNGEKGKKGEEEVQNIQRAQKKWHLEKQRNAIKKHIKKAKDYFVGKIKNHIKRNGATSQKAMRHLQTHLLLVLCMVLFSK